MIGIDEVGRGAWAGPLLVVAARQRAELPVGLSDSKVLSKKVRVSLIEEIKASCDLGRGWVKPGEVDALGLTRAMQLAVQRALAEIKVNSNEEIIMDGSINYCAPEFINVTCVIKADAKYPIVSAASVYAKVTRDDLMAVAAQDYPNHGFEKHVGYGTKAHIEALRKFGLTELHRLSYKPVRAFV